MKTSLGDTLFSTTQQRVLGLLFSQPERTFYTKEILRRTGMGVATIKRELDRMEAAGILTMQPIGNQHHYQPDPNCPIFTELRSIVLKTFGMVDVIREGLATVDEQLLVAFIYGSIAKASDTSKSDIDLMLVGASLSYAEVMDLVQPLEQTLSRTINPTVYAEKEFESKLKNKNSFLTRVIAQPKLWIKGKESDIGATG